MERKTAGSPTGYVPGAGVGTGLYTNGGVPTGRGRFKYTDEERLERSRKRCREYAKRKRDEFALASQRIVDIYNELVRMGAYGQLSDDAKEFFMLYVHREERKQYRYPPTVYKMFGTVIAPGVECTLREAMQRLYRGKNDINYLVRGWDKKHGLHIKVIPAESGEALAARYVIESVDQKEEPERIVSVTDVMGQREKRFFREQESLR